MFYLVITKECARACVRVRARVYIGCGIGVAGCAYVCYNVEYNFDNLYN
jgi:hypothetical protein